MASVVDPTVVATDLTSAFRSLERAESVTRRGGTYDFMSDADAAGAFLRGTDAAGHPVKGRLRGEATLDGRFVTELTLRSETGVEIEVRYSGVNSSPSVEAPI